MKTVLEIKYNKNTPDNAKIVVKIKDLLRSLRGGYKIYETNNLIEVMK